MDGCFQIGKIWVWSHEFNIFAKKPYCLDLKKWRGGQNLKRTGERKCKMIAAIKISFEILNIVSLLNGSRKKLLYKILI